MSDIFREVDEDLRHEKYKELWNRYGNYLIAIALVIAFGVLGRQVWTDYQNGLRASASDRFSAAVELAQSGAAESAVAALEEIESDGYGGYGTLAAFQQAGLQIQNGDLESAIGTYESIAARGGTDRILRDLAVIRAAQLLMDTASRADLEARVGNLISNDNPWRFAAREILAFVAFRDGDMQSAYEQYTTLAGDLVMQQMQATPLAQRVEEMRLVIGPMALEPISAAEPSATPSEIEAESGTTTAGDG